MKPKPTFVIAAWFLAALSGICIPSPARAETPVRVLRAHGHPYLLDFQVLSNKRADLKINVVRKGLNAAFSEWLRAERPHIYRQSLEKR